MEAGSWLLKDFPLSPKERHGRGSGFVLHSSNAQQRPEEAGARPKSVVGIAFKGVAQVSCSHQPRKQGRAFRGQG